jgi:hypothetical protein
MADSAKDSLSASPWWPAHIQCVAVKSVEEEPCPGLYCSDAETDLIDTSRRIAVDEVREILHRVSRKERYRETQAAVERHRARVAQIRLLFAQKRSRDEF